MTGDQVHGKPDDYWDRAGQQGYGQAMYRSSDVESHVRGRGWQTALDIAGKLGVPADGHVLDFGCGDGAFANQILAGHYRTVDGLDKSEAAIRRAQAESQNGATYRAVDLVTFDTTRCRATMRRSCSASSITSKPPRPTSSGRSRGGPIR